jgi:multidrug efflux pump subunit AcrA (membrane-fusion protein)
MRRSEELAHLSAQLEATRVAQALGRELEHKRQRLQSTLAQLQQQAEAETAAAHLRNVEAQAHKEALTQLEIQLIQAQSAASVAERQSIQPALVEALTAAGDKVLLAEVAQNMNLISLFKGKDAGTILSDVLGNLSVRRTLAGLLPDEDDA